MHLGLVDAMARDAARPRHDARDDGRRRGRPDLEVERHGAHPRRIPGGLARVEEHVEVRVLPLPPVLHDDLARRASPDGEGHPVAPQDDAREVPLDEARLSGLRLGQDERLPARRRARRAAEGADRQVEACGQLIAVRPVGRVRRILHEQARGRGRRRLPVVDDPAADAQDAVEGPSGRPVAGLLDRAGRRLVHEARLRPEPQAATDEEHPLVALEPPDPLLIEPRAQRRAHGHRVRGRGKEGRAEREKHGQRPEPKCGATILGQAPVPSVPIAVFGRTSANVA